MELEMEPENANLDLLCDLTEESGSSNAAPLEVEMETWPVAMSHIIYDTYQTLHNEKVSI